MTAKAFNCRIKKVIPEWDCQKCRISKRMTDRELELARQWFNHGKGLTIERIAFRLGFRPTSIAYKLLSKDVAQWYQILWDIAVQRAVQEGRSLDVDRSLLRQAGEYDQAFSEFI
jgi:AraC-like DNA-binding protein